MASINGDMAISKFESGVDFQAKNQSRHNGIDDKAKLVYNFQIFKCISIKTNGFIRLESYCKFT